MSASAGMRWPGRRTCARVAAVVLVASVIQVSSVSTRFGLPNAAATTVVPGVPLGWGNNGSGGIGTGVICQGSQCGQGQPPLYYPSPVSTVNATGVTQVSASLATLAVTSAGTVLSWGASAEGLLLGRPDSLNNEPTPGAIPNFGGVVSVAAGPYDGFALKGDGSVWSWGYNWNGGLGVGDNTQSDYYTPTLVSGLTGVTAISDRAALRSDGTVWMWGDNNAADLGLGTVGGAPAISPIQVPGLSGVTAISSVGINLSNGATDVSHHTLALKSDGTVWGWGEDFQGQIGAVIATGCGPNDACVTSPTMIPGLSNIVAVSAEPYGNLALDANGTVWAWGWNGDALLGNGLQCTNDPPRCDYPPTPVSGLPAIAVISAGSDHNLVLDKTGNVWAWGLNGLGQLGQGDYTNRLTPTLVPGLAGITTTAATGGESFALGTGSAPPVDAINVNAGLVTGAVQPTVTGQTMEWKSDQMNHAWAERTQNRSFETDTVSHEQSTLYDGFIGSTLNRSKWTPTNLDSSSPGSVTQTTGQVSVSAPPGGGNTQFALLSNDLPNVQFADVSVETRVASFTGSNAVLGLYGGSGAGDFSHYVEFGISGGILAVFADGVPAWFGPAASAPGVLKIDLSPPISGGRNLNFYFNGILVHTLMATPLFPAAIRAFLNAGTGTASFNYVTVSPDNTYDSFQYPGLSSRWTPTALAGAAGGYGVGSGQLVIDGTANSRYGMLSQPIANSATDVTTIDTTLNSVTGTNGLFDLYSGTGTFSQFVEFGIEGGHAKVYTPSGSQNWTSSGTYSLPAKLSMQVGPAGPSGRFIYFFVNGTEVYEIVADIDITAADYRVFLYGYGATETNWGAVHVSQAHMFDVRDNGFDPAPWTKAFGVVHPGMPSTFAPVNLAGGTSSGSASESNSQLTIIGGGAGSRYGAMSPALEESDLYGYTVQAKLDTSSGTNALLDIYAGTGAGDFSHELEFGVNNCHSTPQLCQLVSYGDGVPNWQGGNITLPAVLRIEVGPWTSSGRNVFFYANGQLVYSLLNTTVIGNQPYKAFVYGYAGSTSTWDYATWWKTASGTWQPDGFADQASYAQSTNAYNGRYAQTVTNTQHNGGSAGISQDNMSVVAGHQYLVSLYLKQTSLNSSVAITLGPDQPDGPSYSPYASIGFGGITGSWAKYSATITSSTTDQQAKLYIGIAGTGTVSIDMVSVMPLNPSEAVDGGWNTNFVNALTALHLGALRWPGGEIDDWYHWADGVGPRGNRPPLFYGAFESEWMTNDVGTDEVLALAKTLGIPVILGTNLGTGTANEAANWVQYVNGATNTPYGAQRAANGNPTPWGIHTWEVGNENWGFWEPGYLSQQHGTPSGTTYASFFAQWRSAMIVQDPTIDVMAMGGDASAGGTNWTTWDTQLVSYPGNTQQGIPPTAPLGTIELHYYAPEGVPQSASTGDIYNATVGAGVQLSSRLDTEITNLVTNDIDPISHAVFDGHAAITEYNALYFNQADSLSRTLEGGLTEGSMQNLLLRRPEITSLNAASTLVNFWDGSSIRLGNRGSFLTPGALIMSVINNNHGPLLVTPTVTTGSYTAPALGNLPAQTVPYLDVSTTRSADGTNLYLSVINRDPTNNHATSIALAGAGSVGATATYNQVNSPSYLDQNSWQTPTRVGITSGTITGVSANFSYTFPAHSYTEITIPMSSTVVTGPLVVGQVRMGATGPPIAGATVTTDTHLSVITDSQGFYRIAAPTGPLTLTATDPAGGTATETGIVVSTAGATPLPLELNR